MGIKNPYMVKQAIGKTAGQTLELEADTGESFLVKNIYIDENDATMTDITIEKSMVGRWRTAKALGNHLGFPFGSAKIPITNYLSAAIPKKTLMSLLMDMGIFSGYPIAEGQKMVISPAVATEYLGDVVIEYERYEAGDMKSDKENGSEALEYMFINYGDVGSTITTAGDYLINTVNSPSEFPDFPIDKDVPAKTEIDLMGLVASEAYDWDSAILISYTKYLKMVRGRDTLFDDDRNGIFFLGSDRGAAGVATYYGEGFSPIGNYTEIDTKPPFIFPTPLTFMSGEELNTYITSDIVTAAASIAQAGSEVGFIEKVRRVA